MQATAALLELRARPTHTQQLWPIAVTPPAANAQRMANQAPGKATDEKASLESC